MTAKTTTELKAEIKSLKAKILELRKIEKKSENSRVDIDSELSKANSKCNFLESEIRSYKTRITLGMAENDKFKRLIDDLTRNLNEIAEKNDSLLKQLADKNIEFETARDTWMRSNEELSKDSNIVRAFNKEIGENNVELVKKLTEQDEVIELQKNRILELKSFEDDNYTLHNTRFFNSVLVVFCIIELIVIAAVSNSKTHILF